MYVYVYIIIIIYVYIVATDVGVYIKWRYWCWGGDYTPKKKVEPVAAAGILQF